MPKFGVSASPLTPTIHVGRISKKGDAFLDKEDATDMTLAAVGQYVMQHFGGGMEATFPGMGFTLIVSAVPMVAPEPVAEPAEPAPPPEPPSEEAVRQRALALQAEGPDEFPYAYYERLARAALTREAPDTEENPS